MSTEELLSISINELFLHLNASQSGLTSQEAAKRLEIYGYNEFAKKNRRGGAVELLFHLSNPLVLILLLAGLISGFVGERIDAAIIFLIVFLSVILDVYQESKAEKAAEMLKKE